MKNHIRLLVLVSFTALLFSGCLTVEKKEYTFEFTGENSGILTIRYINILSVMDDNTDVSEADFEELINSYLYGSAIEDEYPLANVISKRLYEENNQLCAEVVIQFHDLNSVKLHQFDSNSGYLYALCQCLYSEGFLSSNGSFAGTDVPIVMWPAGTQKLELATYIAEPDETTVSLINHYRKWK